MHKKNVKICEKLKLKTNPWRTTYCQTPEEVHRLMT